MDISRRDALKAGVGVGTFALAARIGAYESIVRAQAQANEPRLQLGSDYFFDDEGDELVISHDIQGDIFRYDPTTDKISTLKPLSSVTTDALTVNGFEGTPIWKEESGSPYSATGASSANFINPSSLDAFDVYFIIYKSTDVAASGNNIDLEVDGATSANYSQLSGGGTRTTGNTEFGPIANHGGSDTQHNGFYLSRSNNDGVMFTNIVRNSGAGVIQSGENVNVTWPIDQFTLFRGVDTDWDAVRVWGRNL